LNMRVEVGGTHLGELVATILAGAAGAQPALPQFGFSTHAVKETSGQH